MFVYVMPTYARMLLFPEYRALNTEPVTQSHCDAGSPELCMAAFQEFALRSGLHSTSSLQDGRHEQNNIKIKQLRDLPYY